MIAAKVFNSILPKHARWALETIELRERLDRCLRFVSKRVLTAGMLGLSISSCSVTASPPQLPASGHTKASTCSLLNEAHESATEDQKSSTPEKPSFSMPQDDLTDYTRHPSYQQFLADTVAMGVQKQHIESALKVAERKKGILKAISQPAEKRLDWGEYRAIFITPDRIEKGKTFLRTHHAAFTQAEEKYGVPKTIMAAIIGVETWYGGNKGNWRVLDALATLGFDYPPREPFFREQLQYFLKLSAEQGWKTTEIKGSYAGAMGYPQFMPSSYRDYAVDFNQDAQTDLINDPVDAIGSVGHYLMRFGWKKGEPVALKARGPADTDAIEALLNQSLKPHQSVVDLYKCGVVPTTKMSPDTQVTARHFKQDGQGEYWLGLENFYVISRYNRSSLYVMAVNQLSEALAK